MSERERSTEFRSAKAVCFSVVTSCKAFWDFRVLRCSSSERSDEEDVYALIVPLSPNGPPPQVLLTYHLSNCLLIFLNDLPVRKRSLLDSHQTQTTDEANQRGFPTSSHWLLVCWLQTLPSSHWLPPLLWWSGERCSLRWNQRNPLSEAKILDSVPPL